MDDDIYEINKKLNKTPYKTIGYKYPVKLFNTFRNLSRKK